MRIKTELFSLSVLCPAILATSAFATDPVGEPGRSASGKNPLKNVYFGEEHLHTSASPDAFVIGGTNTWEDAYNWAMGK